MATTNSSTTDPHEAAEPTGRRYWRSLEELAETPEFRAMLEREFPAGASEWSDRTGRRRFLQLMGASIGLAGLTGCYLKPEEKIVPFVRKPEELIPGIAMHFATSMPWNGAAIGLLVESHMGRPTKIEGNELHPASLGASGIFEQASLLTLYDPDRSQTTKSGSLISSWNAFLTSLLPRLEVQRSAEGAGLRILTESVCSPTLAAQLRDVLQAFPQAKAFSYEPVNRDNERLGLQAAFAADVQPVPDLRRADVIVSLDADFLTHGPGQLRHARDFAARRRLNPEDPARTTMNRLYVVETTPTLTGAAADHRLATSAGGVEAVAAALARELGIPVENAPALPANVPQAWITAAAADLQEYRVAGGEGGALVLAGPWQPPLVHALAHAINARLNAMGTTIHYLEAPEADDRTQLDGLKELVEEMRDEQVELLLILGGNPAFTAPADLAFAAALDKVPFRVHLGLYDDETSALCQWHIPETHYLESWSDARAFDGTASIQQPLIAPLYEGRSPHDLLSVLVDKPGAKSYDTVRAFWQKARPTDDPSATTAGLDFDDWWQTIVHDGVIPGTAAPAVEVALVDGFRAVFESTAPAPAVDALQIVFRPDPAVWDGRLANNGWMQELPRPFSKLTWDNAALIGPETARALGLPLTNQAEQPVVRLETGERIIAVPVWIVPGVPQNCVTVHFGNGRSRVGRIGRGCGTDVYPLRTTSNMWFAHGARIQTTGRTSPLATTQHHHLMEGRHLVRSGTLQEFLEHPDHPDFVHTGHAADVSFYPPFEYDGYKWGMSINLGSCIGCNACVVACQAENNIPVVGKEEVMRGREMHWIRVDRYFEGEMEAPSTHFQPVPCMHCELAPCEVVCPVAATTHSDEGLNEMTYNRCVGTRYCANNCPYKVRRFNFFHYTQPVEDHPTLQLIQNPDVTVRSRGVMEKCSYCVQRISAGRIGAEKERRKIRDGEVVTACQQACPTQAIVFGDMNDTTSKIHAAKQQSLDYALLGELNTRPRTTYQASLRNPNPQLASPKHHERNH